MKDLKKIKCKYCELYFKNRHGLHIHWFYCLVKSFSEMEKQTVNNQKYRRLMEDSSLISIYSLPRVYVKFFEDGEFGMIFNIRYILK